MQTIAIANHKGGVGKTATAHNLGSLLAEDGIRVLLVDTDPQASLTQTCGVGVLPEDTLSEVLGGSGPGSLKLKDIIVEIDNGLYLAPAYISLSTSELGLTSRLGRESVLRKALATVASNYDVCVIDCPPSLGLLTINALVGSDSALVPTQPQAVDLRGLVLFLDTLNIIRAELNPDLEILGVLITFFDGRLTHHKEAINVMKEAGIPLLDVYIGRSVRVAEAGATAQPVTNYEPKNPRSDEYKKLATEVKQWLKRNPKP